MNLGSLGIRHAALPAQDLPRALRFYTEVLGFTPYHVTDRDWAMVHCEGTTISLVRSSILPPSPTLSENGKKQSHPAHLGWTVSTQADVDTHHKKVLLASSAVTAPKLHRDGSYGFYFLDSEGNQLECIFIPHAPMSLREMEMGAILLGHGSTDPAWSKPFETLLARFRENTPGMPCELAFMEGIGPALGEAIASVLKQKPELKKIHVIPVLLASGGHIKNDLPRLVTEAARHFPTISLTHSAPLGETEIVQDSLVVAAISALAENA